MLGRLAYDLGRRSAGFGLVVWVFWAVFLVLALAQLRAAWSAAADRSPLTRGQRMGLVLAVPFGLLGSIVDCMGLSFHGCSVPCAFLSRAVAPAVALLVAAYGLTDGSVWRSAALGLAFVLLVPNCRCRNPVNAFWIDLLGLSPACFVSGFSVTLVALSALATRRHAGAALALAWSTIAVLLVFFVGHHYYDWPW
jgi:hypothetical protein